MTSASVTRLESLQPGEWTTGRTLMPTLYITDPNEASAYFAALVGMLVKRWGKTVDESQFMTREAIAHVASVLGDEDAPSRVARLFGARKEP